MIWHDGSVISASLTWVVSMLIRTFIFCMSISVLLMLMGSFVLSQLPAPAATGWSLVFLGVMLAGFSVVQSSLLARANDAELQTEHA